MTFVDTSRAAADSPESAGDNLRAAPAVRLSRGLGGCLLLLLLVAGIAVPAALGETKKADSKKSAASKKKIVANTQALDVKADQIQAEFVKGAAELADEYVEAGHLDKAKALLQGILALRPDAQGIQQKLKQLDENILGANDSTIEVSAARSWEPTGLRVAKNLPVRFQVDGTYRFSVNTTLGPDGFSEREPKTDMVSGIPAGALMGLILNDEGKPGKPFAIGSGRDINPQETGLLFLRINAPPENKNTGKVTVLISGYVRGP